MRQVGLEDALRATLDSSSPRGRFDSLQEERHWPLKLASWLELEPGQPVPSRRDIVGRLTIEIAAIDRLVGRQLDAVLHHPKFSKLEASWRGLHSLHELRCRLIGREASLVELRVCDLSWHELTRDLERASEFDQSQLFQLIYSEELDQPGGTPYGAILGDYAISHRRSSEHRDDIGTLRGIANVAAASFCPFITAADPELLGLESFTELERPIDLERTLRGDEYIAWNSLRRLSDARFLGITLPGVLMRRPYRDDPTRADGFRYAEDTSNPDGSGMLWGTAVYPFGQVLIRAFVDSGWLAAIRGVEEDVESRGIVTGLAHDWHAPELRGVAPKGSLEVQLTEAQEHQLGELGFMPLLHCHGTRYAAFYSNQSIQDWRATVPSGERDEAATADAKLSSMLQYMFCVSRFSHYVKVIAREKVGSFTNATDLQRLLADWLVNYATSNAGATATAQAKYPLRNARVEVEERAGSPGTYICQVHLQPHYQLDQLATSINLTTDISTAQGM